MSLLTIVSRHLKPTSSPCKNICSSRWSFHLNHRSFAAKKAVATPKGDQPSDEEIKRQQEFKERLFKTLGGENIEQEEVEMEDEYIQTLRTRETELKKLNKQNPITEGLPYKWQQKEDELATLEDYRAFAEVPIQHIVRNLGHGALPDRIKMDMYRLWRKDPKYWTLNNLSAKFHTIPERVYSIIVDKRREHHQTILEGRPLDTWHQETYEKEFAHFITERIPNDAMRKQEASPHFDFLEGDVDENKAAYLLRKSLHHPGFGRVPHHELPEEPPKRFTNLQKVRTAERVLIPARKKTEEVEKLRDLHNIPEGGGKITFVDSSPRRHPYTREIYVWNIDGSVRTANWEERRDLLKPPTKMLPLQRRFEEEVKISDELFGKQMKLRNEAARNEPNVKTPKKNVNYLDVLEGREPWLKETPMKPEERLGPTLDVWADRDQTQAGQVQSVPGEPNTEALLAAQNEGDIDETEVAEGDDPVGEALDLLETTALNLPGAPYPRNPYDVPVPGLPAWFDNILGTSLERSMFEEPKPFDSVEEEEELEPINENDPNIVQRFEDLIRKEYPGVKLSTEDDPLDFEDDEQPKQPAEGGTEPVAPPSEEKK
eukprot:TRINITY_DN3724_c0_g1_i1.p1 TRINITY_DN3724_c0_g1~~TRINITY_DN3724_c0_g1_i1.p1  ORF type:complete len:600 (+),score=189.72 TRINITY_DN3724_c0_g1_i1:128-1927(+)